VDILRELMAPKQDNLERLFNPRSIAVIGASTKEGKVGHTLFSNILESGYEGEVYPVNPKGGNVLGRELYESIEDLPEPIDLAVIVVPAKIVKEAVHQCGEKGVEHIIVISSGFSEVGKVEEERALVEEAKKYGMRVLGPNVFGIYSAKSDLNATFGPSEIEKGSIALLSQSGALGIALIGKTAQQYLGLSAIVSIGNKADIDDVDLVEYFSQDDESEVIMVYMEGLDNGQEFMETAEGLEEDKTVIVLKSGRSEKGATAVASHTGSLAGSDRIFSSAFEQCGVLRAENLREAFNWSRAFSNSPLPENENTVVVTNGGGIGVLSADAAEECDVKLLDDQTHLKETFEDVIPSFGSTKNPIDITGQAGKEEYERSLRRAYESEKIGSVIGLYCEAGSGEAWGGAKAIKEVYEEYGDEKTSVFTFVGGKQADECVQWLRKHKIPAYTDTYECVSALGALYKKKRYLERKRERDDEIELDIPIDEIREKLKGIRNKGRLTLLEHEAREILDLAGIPMVEGKVVNSLDRAVEAAEEIGYPVVLKVVSEDIIHKSDAGGLALNLENEEEVVDAYQAIYSNCRKNYPDAHISGISVAKMLEGGEETIVGGSRDSSFGPLVMFGLGGVYVEVLEDVEFRVAPITKKEARRMMGQIESFPVLVGARGQPRKDLNALADVIYRISYLMNEVEGIAEMDLNPIKAFDRGEGCKVVDVAINLENR
ncbi:MAG: acetate--CoA ligase family protein, partial [Candidatus Thermoplasmatota archaeon]|nr:acetate--CoA ligase family protein [Candidatus Thermoplasmatota archaeon]